MCDRVYDNLCNIINDDEYRSELKRLFLTMKESDLPREHPVYLKLPSDDKIFIDFIKRLNDKNIYNIPIYNIRVEIAKEIRRCKQSN